MSDFQAQCEAHLETISEVTQKLYGLSTDEIPNQEQIMQFVAQLGKAWGAIKTLMDTVQNDGMIGVYAAMTTAKAMLWKFPETALKPAAPATDVIGTQPE